MIGNEHALDFSTVIERELFAVHLKSQSQSDHFLKEIERQYGFRFRKLEGYWSECKDRTVYVVRKNRNNPLAYTSLDSAIDSNYYVVEYEDLVPVVKEFEVSDENDLIAFLGIKI